MVEWQVSIDAAGDRRIQAGDDQAVRTADEAERRIIAAMKAEKEEKDRQWAQMSKGERRKSMKLEKKEKVKKDKEDRKLMDKEMQRRRTTATAVKGK